MWRWARVFQVMLRFEFHPELGHHCSAEESLKTFVGKRIIVAAMLRMDYEETKEETGKPIRSVL